jgi:spore coat protein H
LAILACGVAAFAVVVWRGNRPEQASFDASQAFQPRARFTPVGGSLAQELPLQAEESLAKSTLPLYELRMTPSDLRSIEMEPFGNTTYPATFVAGGKVYQVKVRARGSWSRSWPKKSLKIQFDHKNPFQEHNSLDLNSCWRDPAFVREALAYRVYAACGATASRAQMVRLQVNGRFHGLYVDVEQPDKEFLARYNLKGAELYKAASRSRDADERELGDVASYQGAYTKETKKTEDCHDLAEFCQQLARSADTTSFFNQHVELDGYINYLAATVLIQHWDGFNKNHYLAHEASGKWLVIPWDLDRTFGDHWQMRFDVARLPILLGTRAAPGVTGWNRLEDRFFSEPALRVKFLDRLSELLEKEFTTEKLFPVLDQLEAQIGSAAQLDRTRWPSPAGDLHDGIAGVKSFIEQRRAYLQQEIPRLRRL